MIRDEEDSLREIWEAEQKLMEESCKVCQESKKQKTLQKRGHQHSHPHSHSKMVEARHPTLGQQIGMPPQPSPSAASAAMGEPGGRLGASLRGGQGGGGVGGLRELSSSAHHEHQQHQHQHPLPSPAQHQQAQMVAQMIGQPQASPLGPSPPPHILSFYPNAAMPTTYAASAGPAAVTAPAAMSGHGRQRPSMMSMALEVRPPDGGGLPSPSSTGRESTESGGRFSSAEEQQPLLGVGPSVSRSISPQHSPRLIGHHQPFLASPKYNATMYQSAHNPADDGHHPEEDEDDDDEETAALMLSSRVSDDNSHSHSMMPRHDHSQVTMPTPAATSVHHQHFFDVASNPETIGGNSNLSTANWTSWPAYPPGNDHSTLYDLHTHGSASGDTHSPATSTTVFGVGAMISPSTAAPYMAAGNNPRSSLGSMGSNITTGSISTNGLASSGSPGRPLITDNDHSHHFLAWARGRSTTSRRLAAMRQRGPVITIREREQRDYRENRRERKKDRELMLRRVLRSRTMLAEQTWHKQQQDHCHDHQRGRQQKQPLEEPQHLVEHCSLSHFQQELRGEIHHSDELCPVSHQGEHYRWRRRKRRRRRRRIGPIDAWTRTSDECPGGISGKSHDDLVTRGGEQIALAAEPQHESCPCCAHRFAWTFCNASVADCSHAHQLGIGLTIEQICGTKETSGTPSPLRQSQTTTIATRTPLKSHLQRHSSTCLSKGPTVFPVAPAVPVATCVSRAGEDGVVRVTTVGLKQFWRSVGVGRPTSSVPPDSAGSGPTLVLPQPHRPIVALQWLPTILAPSLVARLLSARQQRSRVECV